MLESLERDYTVQKRSAVCLMIVRINPHLFVHAIVCVSVLGVVIEHIGGEMTTIMLCNYSKYTDTDNNVRKQVRM